MARVRLNKFLAECGVASRRRADELIESGQIQVNGKRVYELGQSVDPDQDRVVMKGKTIRPQTQKLYIALYKPKNMVTTMRDPEGRPSVGDLLKGFPHRLFPVGRLDWDSEGLLILTNDGAFAQKLSHPRYEVPKTYLVKVNGQPADHHLKKLLNGVSIIGGKVKALEAERIRHGTDKTSWLRLVITEGKNRQVRQMMAKVGFDVLKLQRVAIGRLRIGKMKRGEFRKLDPDDVARLFQPLRSDERMHAKPPPNVARPSRRPTLPKTRRKFLPATKAQS